jgi:hypothetical protein
VTLWLIVGCGPSLQSVKGTVTLPDGKPATGSMVVFESQSSGAAVTARGDVQTDGSYTLSTLKPGDGVPPGKYRVAVVPPAMVSAEGPNIVPFNPKFATFETSGLEFEVERGKQNEFPIKVTK